VAILHAFAIDESTLPLAEIVRRTGLHKATTFRVANELVDLRLLERSESGYRLSGGLFELGMRASAERSYLELAMPFLQELYERTHETVHLGVPDHDEVVYIAKLGGHRQVASPSRVGGGMPMYCTAIGKALLAHADRDLQSEVLDGVLVRRTPRTVVAPGILKRQLRAVRSSGVAFEREESTQGLLCVAAPIFDADGHVGLAISVTGPVGRFRPEGHVAAVRAAAAGIESIIRRRDRPATRATT